MDEEEKVIYAYKYAAWALQDARLDPHAPSREDAQKRISYLLSKARAIVDPLTAVPEGLLITAFQQIDATLEEFIK